MKRWCNRNAVFSAVLALVALAIVIRIVPPFVPAVIELELGKNAEPITRIDQPREIEYRRTLAVDRLELAHRNRLRHPELGRIGYGEQFFVDIEHDFEVLEAGDYRFVIGSDDGFIARVDGQPLCRFDRDRAYRENTCPVRLEAGTHEFTLNYFQGGGQAGLTVQYRRAGEEESFFFGEDSRWLRF